MAGFTPIEQKTRFVSISADTREGRLLDVDIPDAIYVVPCDMTGKEFLHLSRVLPFDQGHDWRVEGDKVRLSPAAADHYHFVFRYGPEPSCCGNHLPQGARFCPMCGTPTKSTVEVL